MKLYIMNCGQMITPDGNILAAFNTEQLRLVIPVPAYLIEHPTEGLVLIDCGFDVEEHILCHKGAYTGKSGITRDRTGKLWYYRNSKR